MATNSTNKKQAVNLIKRLVADGWSRKVETMTLCGKVSNVTVTLSREVRHPWHTDWSQVFVCFRRPVFRGRRSSVAVRTQTDYRPKLISGLCYAGFAASHLRDSAARLSVNQ